MAARYVVINGRRVLDPRQTRAWRTLRDLVVREEPVCQLAFAEICTTLSTTADHIEPVAVRPELALVRANLRGACGPCNEARGHLPDSALRLGRDDVERPALDVFKVKR